MDPADAWLLALAVAGLLVALFGKPAKTLVGGVLQRDRKGRMTLVLTPARRPKKGRRGRGKH